MNFNIPEYVNRVLNELEKAGFEGYIVGGSVRDLFLNKEPSDYDIATSATPDEIEIIFKNYKTLYIGKKFGTVVVVQPEGNIEVTTYRTEGEYLDGRRPSEVFFSKDIYEDLSRRDFTINAMAYNNEEVIDPYNGQIDIQNKIIKTVGNPKQRFKEDNLRILRAVRFSTQLNFTIEQDTYNACKEFSNSLVNISVERIRDELFKIILSNKPSNGIRLLNDLGILKIIIPELLTTVDYDQQNPNHSRNLFEHILCVLDNTPPVLTLRMAALLHDIAKPLTFSIDEKGIGHYYGHDKKGAETSYNILNRLKCSKGFIETVTMFIREHMYHSSMKTKGIKRQLGRVGEEYIFDLIDLQRADMICKNDKKDISVLDVREKQIRDILINKEPYQKSHLNIDGNDIMSLGFKQGKIIDEIYDNIMEKVLVNPQLNEKQKLIEMIKNIKKV